MNFPENAQSVEKEMAPLMELRETLTSQQILCFVSGCISKQLLEVIVATLRDKISRLPGLEKEVQYSVNVMVEMIQNIVNYSPCSENFDIAKHSLLLLAQSNSRLSAFSSNLILNESAPNLKKRLDFINSLSPEQVKEEFRKVRRGTVKENQIGAGLGLLEMAKISQGKLVYSLVPHKDNYSFFNLKVSIF